jgi:hypothetical protein
MKRIALVTRHGLSFLLLSGLLLAPAIARGDDASVDAVEDGAVADASTPTTDGVASTDAATEGDVAADAPVSSGADGGSDGAGGSTDGGAGKESDGGEGGAAGTGGKGGSGGSGGAAGVTVFPEDDAGCSVAGGVRGSVSGLVLAAMSSLVVRRRRRRA